MIILAGHASCMLTRQLVQHDWHIMASYWSEDPGGGMVGVEEPILGTQHYFLGLQMKLERSLKGLTIRATRKVFRFERKRTTLLKVDTGL